MSNKTENVNTNPVAPDPFLTPSGSNIVRNKPQEVEPQPNIKFVGRVKNSKFTDKATTPDESEWIDREAPESLTIGKLVFKMPDTDLQSAGFFHPEGHLIIRTFPRLYKRFVEKGVE